MSTKQVKVGVIICSCKNKLHQYLDFQSISKELKKIKEVSAVIECSDLCDTKESSDVISKIKKTGADRLVVCGCDKRVYENEFVSVLKKEKINEGLWWPVNISDDCARAVKGKKAATDICIQYISAAVKRLAFAEAVGSTSREIIQDISIIGSGISGMQSAILLSALGYKINMLFAGKEMGGYAAAHPDLYAYLDTDPAEASEKIKKHMYELSHKIKDDKNISMYADTTVQSVDGNFGDFLIQANTGEKEISIKSGAVVLAMGSQCRQASAGSIFTDEPNLMGMDRLYDIMSKGKVPQRIVFLMDQNREQERGTTSAVLSAALKLVKEHGASVKIYCNNVRVAAYGLEALYRRTRDAGVVVIKYNEKPKIKTEENGIFINLYDTITGTILSEEADLVVIADCEPISDDAVKANTIEGLRRGPDKELQYNNIWLLPALSNRVGIFVIGGAKGNSEYREALVDGLACAWEIHEQLKENKIQVYDDVAKIDAEKCALCLTCMRICPHGAIFIDHENESAGVQAVSCRKCGMCAAECPAGAIQLIRYSDNEIEAELAGPAKVVAFACENSAIPAGVSASESGLMRSKDIRLIRIPCAGKVNPNNVLAALEAGADKVMIIGCHPESCKYLSGSSRASRRMERLSQLLEKAGIDPLRVSFNGIASVETKRFEEYVSDT
ncbi:hydrogenase iron-sulfur subunit [Spirochaetota bacterium]